MNSQILLSVIIPIYNTYGYITTCLNSLERQHLSCNYEIICVDDGSTQPDFEILEQYRCTHHFVRFYKITHGGQGSARNYGLKQARGKYVYFMDSDDMLVDGALEACIEALQTSESDMVLFNAEPKYESKQLEERFPFYKTLYLRKKNYPHRLTGIEMFTEMMRNSDYIVSPCCYVVSKETLESNNIKFPEGIIYEDNVFTLNVFLHTKRVVYIPKTFFIRIVREGSTTTRQKNIFDVYSYFMCFLHIYQISQGITVSRQTRKYIEKIGVKMLRYSREIYLKIGSPRDLKNYQNTFPIFGEFLFIQFITQEKEKSKFVMLLTEVSQYYRANGIKKTVKKIIMKFIR